MYLIICIWTECSRWQRQTQTPVRLLLHGKEAILIRFHRGDGFMRWRWLIDMSGMQHPLQSLRLERCNSDETELKPWYQARRWGSRGRSCRYDANSAVAVMQMLSLGKWITYQWNNFLLVKAGFLWDRPLRKWFVTSPFKWPIKRFSVLQTGGLNSPGGQRSLRGFLIMEEVELIFNHKTLIVKI